MNEGTVITGYVVFGVFMLWWTFVSFMVGFTVGDHYAKHELEAAIQDAIELMDEEPAKEILKQALKG